MFAHNKTSLGLKKLPYLEREQLMKTARHLAPKFRAKFKARRQEIEDRRIEDKKES